MWRRSAFLSIAKGAARDRVFRQMARRSVTHQTSAGATLGLRWTVFSRWRASCRRSIALGVGDDLTLGVSPSGRIRRRISGAPEGHLCLFGDIFVCGRQLAGDHLTAERLRYRPDRRQDARLRSSILSREGLIEDQLVLHKIGYRPTQPGVLPFQYLQPVSLARGQKHSASGGPFRPICLRYRPCPMPRIALRRVPWLSRN